MLVNGEVRLSAGCPAEGTWEGPLTPESLTFFVEDEPSRGVPMVTHVFAAFMGSEPGNPGMSNDKDTEEIGGFTFPAGSRDAESYHALVETQSERQIGEYFCEKVAECEGPLSLDGPAFCPALNNIELRKLV